MEKNVFFLFAGLYEAVLFSFVGDVQSKSQEENGGTANKSHSHIYQMKQCRKCAQWRPSNAWKVTSKSKNHRNSSKPMQFMQNIYCFIFYAFAHACQAKQERKKKLDVSL